MTHELLPPPLQVRWRKWLPELMVWLVIAFIISYPLPPRYNGPGYDREVFCYFGMLLVDLTHLTERRLIHMSGFGLCFILLYPSGSIRETLEHWQAVVRREGRYVFDANAAIEMKPHTRKAWHDFLEGSFEPTGTLPDNTIVWKRKP